MSEPQDNSGRSYAKIADVREGAKLETDGGFTCMKAKEIKTVKKDAEGGLFIDCSEGGHSLMGQAEDDYYVGLYPAN